VLKRMADGGRRTALTGLMVLLGGALACGDTVGSAGVESPASGDIVALGANGDIFWVDPTDPDSLQGGVVWAAGNEVQVVIGYRPATGVLYGRGADGGLYEVEPGRGTATQFGTVAALTGASSFAGSFSSLTDRWRIVTNVQQNARYNPVNAGLTLDNALNTAAVIGAIAYSPPAAGLQTLYAIDNTNKQLVRIGGPDGDPSPDLGAIQVVGPLNLGTPTVSARGMVITSTGVAYAAIVLSDDNLTKLYTINLTTGAATLVGTVANGVAIRAIAMAP